MEDQKIDVLVIKQLLAYGKKLGFLTSQCGHGTMWISEQVISDPTHILESSSSYIDLIFLSQPNLVMNSGVNFSLHPICHHQIIHAKFNLKIFYQLSMNESSGTIKMHIMVIQRSISQFNWERVFSNKVVYWPISILMKIFLICILFLYLTCT